MTEAVDTAMPGAPASPQAASAGAMLRAARESRGLHIAALAASIKVSPRKLEALEADRHGDLPDMTFTRALAQTVCRALKVDAEAVLARLPQAGDMAMLSQMGAGLNAPFREAPGSRTPGDYTLLRKPMFWATLAVLLGALALALVPEQWMSWRTAGAPTMKSVQVAPATLPSAAAVPEPMPTVAASAPVVAQVETVHSAPPPAAGVAPIATDSPAGVLAIRTTADSWVEVEDARGQMLLSRTVQPGEAVGLNGAMPLRVTIGNAGATQLTFRGQVVDIAASTRENVARLQLR